LVSIIFDSFTAVKLSEVIGHQEVKDKLSELLTAGKLPHAMMILGPEGSGRIAAGTSYRADIWSARKTLWPQTRRCRTDLVAPVYVW
jgi:hypothetical protein